MALSYSPGVKIMNPVINRRPLIISLSSLLLILIAAAGLALAFIPRENTIFPGVSVNGQYVGGLTGPQAAELLKKHFDESSTTGYIQLQDGREKWVIHHEDLGVTYDFFATAEKALKIGKKGSVIEQTLGMIVTYFVRPDITLHYYIDYDKLDRVLADVSSKIDITAENASICMYYGRPKIYPAVTGRTLNISSARQQIDDALGRLDGNPILLDVETNMPDFMSDSLSEINGSIGQGITAASPSKPFRFAALKAAVSKLNGILLIPGEQFSFNTEVGQGLKELIYRYGTVIHKDGKPVLANSGGTSQAASTLYQAVLNSGLKVTERYAHKVSPAYAMPGQDAAVVKGKLDFKFENDTGHPVYIMAEIKDNKMIVDLMGVQKDGQTR